MGFSALDLEVQFLGPLPTQPHTPQPLGLIPRKQRNSVDRETTEDEDGQSRSLPHTGGGAGRLLSRAGRPGVRPSELRAGRRTWEGRASESEHRNNFNKKLRLRSGFS